MNGAIVLAWALDIAVGAVALAMLMCAWRLLRGPSLPDRVLALDTLYINAIALAVLLGLRQGSALFFEAALIIAMLGFVSTVAAARYLARGDVIE
jgi:multicomponent K+:H+ antiporter subunit F